MVFIKPIKDTRIIEGVIDVAHKTTAASRPVYKRKKLIL